MIVEKTGFQFFYNWRLMKNKSDWFSKKQSWVSLPYAFSFVSIGEPYLYYEKSPTYILYSRVEKSVFFLKKPQKLWRKWNLKQKLLPNSIGHIVCKFQKGRMKSKKNAKFGDGPLNTDILPVEWRTTMFVPIYEKSSKFDPFNHGPKVLNFFVCKSLDE